MFPASLELEAWALSLGTRVLPGLSMGAGLAPGLLDPLVERVGVLGELLAQLVILLLPALFLLQLQLPFLRITGRQTPRQPWPFLHGQA